MASSGGRRHRHRVVRESSVYRVVSRRYTVAVRGRVTASSRGRVEWITTGSSVPAERAELVGRQLVPVGRVVPHASHCLGRLEDQTIATARSGHVGRRDFVDAPVRSQRVDEAKARVRHQAFDSILVGVRQPETTASCGRLDVRTSQYTCLGLSRELFRIPSTQRRRPANPS